MAKMTVNELSHREAISPSYIDVEVGVDTTDEDETDLSVQDWKLPLTFSEKRHIEHIEAVKTVTQTWRMKERVRFNSICFYICYLYCKKNLILAFHLVHCQLCE